MTSYYVVLRMDGYHADISFLRHIILDLPINVLPDFRIEHRRPPRRFAFLRRVELGKGAALPPRQRHWILVSEAHRPRPRLVRDEIGQPDFRLPGDGRELHRVYVERRIWRQILRILYSLLSRPPSRDRKSQMDIVHKRRGRIRDEEERKSTTDDN